MAKTKEEDSKNFSQSTLHRSSKNKIVAGVAGGLGEYFSIDPTIIRIIFVLLTLFSGGGVLIYVILWIVMPSEHSKHSNPKDHIKENVDDLKETAQKFAHDIKLNQHKNSSDSKIIFGAILIFFGLLFLLNSLGIFGFYNIDHLWPLILIIIGLLLLSRKHG